MISGVKPLIPVSRFVPISVVNRLNIHGDIATAIAINMFVFQRREIGDFQKCISELGIITIKSGPHIIKPCPIPVFTWVVNIPDAEVWKSYKYGDSNRILRISIAAGIQSIFTSSFESVANIFKKNIANIEAINIGKFHRFEKLAVNRHIADMTQVKMFVALN